MFAALTTVGVTRPPIASAVEAPALPRAPSAPRSLPPWPFVPVGDPGGLTDLAGVAGWAGDCRRCKLAGTRTNLVFGQGNPNADLMFVGEAPGADEDEQGLAFVGRAGQLLTDIIEKGMKMSRADVYIANILMCRPPGNRNPEPDEIQSCQPFLEKKIELIRPRVIVGLGRFPSQWLMKTEEPIGRIRGRVGDYHGIKVVPTYHPAYLLRNPSAKKDVWDDMKVVLSLLAS
jgi:DNA polymerase